MVISAWGYRKSGILDQLYWDGWAIDWDLFSNIGSRALLHLLDVPHAQLVPLVRPFHVGCPVTTSLAPRRPHISTFVASAFHQEHWKWADQLAQQKAMRRLGSVFPQQNCRSIGKAKQGLMLGRFHTQKHGDLSISFKHVSNIACDIPGYNGIHITAFATSQSNHYIYIWCYDGIWYNMI